MSTVAVLKGGRSLERQVSLVSGARVAQLAGVVVDPHEQRAELLA